MALKNIAESAGMVEHCDFDVEDTLVSGRGGSRVDMIARIPGEARFLWMQSPSGLLLGCIGGPGF